MCVLRLFVLAVVLVLTCGAQPLILNNGVVNGASFVTGQPITPGSLISIFGTELSSGIAQADSIPLATALGGVSVNFVTPNGTISAPMMFVSPSQVNLQVPWDAVPPGTTQSLDVVVVRNGAPSAPASVMVGPFSPGLFASGEHAVAVHQDGALAWPTGAVAGVVSRPAKPGDILTVYATGLGAVDSPPANGQNASGTLRHTVVAPTVLIGGLTSEVQFSGLSPEFVGVNQLNVVVPAAAPGDAVPMQIQVGGITTPASLVIAVTR